MKSDCLCAEQILNHPERSGPALVTWLRSWRFATCRLLLLLVVVLLAKVQNNLLSRKAEDWGGHFKCKYSSVITGNYSTINRNPQYSTQQILSCAISGVVMNLLTGGKTFSLRHPCCACMRVCVRKQEFGQKLGLRTSFQKESMLIEATRSLSHVGLLIFISERGRQGFTDSRDYAIKRLINPLGLGSH